MTLRCAIHGRFSTEMQSPRSTADQERECRGFAERQGWNVVLVEHDEAVRAGASAGRLGFQRLLAAAKQRKFDVLLVEEISRFSRDFFGGFAALAELQKYDVQLADTKLGLLDLNTSLGQLQVAFGLATSQQETQRLGERSKRGLKGKVLSGFSAGGQPAYGFTRQAVFSTTQVDVDGRPLRVGVRLAPATVEAAIVRRIFSLYAGGNTKHGIATLLNREGVLTRDAGRVRNGKRISGLWSTAQVKAMLENEIYVGERVWDRTSRKGEKSPVTGKKEQKPNPEAGWTRVKEYVEPIIDSELWDAVQVRLKSDARKYDRKHTANENKRYLLSGLLRCASCGGSFVIGAHRGRPPVPHYRCSFHASRGRTACQNTTVVSQPGVEARAKALLDVVVKDPKQLKALVVEHNKRISSANEGQLATVRALEARKKAAADERDRFVGAIAAGSGAPKVLVSEIEKREQEIEQLETRIAEAAALVQPLLLPRPAALPDFVSGKATLFTGEHARDRELLERMIEGIIVYPDGSLVAAFREASLFEPMRFAQLPPTASVTETAPLAQARGAHATELARMRAEAAQVLSPEQLANLEVDVLQDADGKPAFVMMTKGAVSRSFAGVPVPRRPSGEIALASPGGFEPPLAT